MDDCCTSEEKRRGLRTVRRDYPSGSIVRTSHQRGQEQSNSGRAVAIGVGLEGRQEEGRGPVTAGPEEGRRMR
jgi:hypothetical protein